MNKLRIMILTLSAVLTVAMIGVAAASRHEVRDPENPAFVGYVAPANESTTQIVRDPDNPYWNGAASHGTPSGSVNSLGLR